MKMEEWKECTLSDLGTIVGGATPSTKDSSNYENGSIAWITPKDLSTHTERFISHGERNITEKGLKSCSAQLMPPNSILFTSRAPIGYIAIAKNEVCTNQGFKSIVPNKDTDFMFLYYLLKYNKDNIENLGSGTTFKEVSGSTMKSVPVKVPPLPTQQKIAAILSSLDDKIELNNKINTNLEQQAQALFKNWFVDCMNSNTKMSDIIDVRDGTHDSPKPQESGYLLVTSKHLEAYSINPTAANFITKEDYEKINERSKVDNGDILLSMIGTVGIVSLVIDNPVTWAIKNIGLFKTSKSEELKYFLLNYLKCDDVKNYIEQHLAGSTQKYISLSELRNLPINIPEKTVLEKFNNVVTPIYEQIINNTNEIKNLKELRDTLLPKLMNGGIKVDEVRK